MIGPAVRGHDKGGVKAHILRFYNKMLNLICPNTANGRLDRPTGVANVDVIHLLARLEGTSHTCSTAQTMLGSDTPKTNRIEPSDPGAAFVPVALDSRHLSAMPTAVFSWGVRFGFSAEK